MRVEHQIKVKVGDIAAVACPVNSVHSVGSRSRPTRLLVAVATFVVML